LSSAPSPPISTTNINNKRWRLVVLEASWAHGQTMFRQVLF
jgi:DTW domain-containing protein YfiP